MQGGVGLAEAGAQAFVLSLRRPQTVSAASCSRVFERNKVAVLNSVVLGVPVELVEKTTK
ncbi:hypothetical protein GCM10010359_55660 [Streptomyces morookaense]|nr:hypothetical protein GCM10010359_55660 [Streptomyces morookaense]